MLSGVIPTSHANDGERLIALVSQWYQQAEQDDADALFNLGQYYRQGIGIQPDLDQAVLFYQRAAELGHTAAQLNLGSLYYFTLPAAPNIEQAKHFWTQAAEANHPDAQYLLAILLLKHEIDSADAQAAASDWLIQAAESGHQGALQLLQQNQAAPPAQPPQSTAMYAVQLGAFSTHQAAERFAESVNRDFLTHLTPPADAFNFKIVALENAAGVTLYRYVLGDFATKQQASAVCDTIKHQGSSCYVMEFE